MRHIIFILKVTYTKIAMYF